MPGNSCPVCKTEILPSCLHARHVIPCQQCYRTYSPTDHSDCPRCTVNIHTDEILEFRWTTADGTNIVPIEAGQTGWAHFRMEDGGVEIRRGIMVDVGGGKLALLELNITPWTQPPPPPPPQAQPQTQDQIQNQGQNQPQNASGNGNGNGNGNQAKTTNGRESKKKEPAKTLYLPR